MSLFVGRLKIFGSVIEFFWGAIGKKSANYSMLKMDIVTVVPQ